MFDGKFVISAGEKELCGERFHDMFELKELLERYAIGKHVRVTVQMAELADNKESEDGAQHSSF